MKKREWVFLFASLAAYLILRGPDLFGPFIFPFENAFQEAIALHHLPDRFLSNRLLPVLARFDGQNFYHTAHPPLLHLLYALLYLLFGVHEYVTRGFALLCFLVSFLLWRAMLGEETKRGWVIFPLAFFLPVPFLLLTTTNYEPLSIFMISLLAWMILYRDSRLRSLFPLLTLGLLVDWPVYLAVPALLIIKWREREKRHLLLTLFGYEIIFFLALQAYQSAVAGEAAFFSHAPTRMSPFALFSLATWRELFSHYLELSGWPITILSAAIFWAWVSSRVAPFLRSKAFSSEQKSPGSAQTAESQTQKGQTKESQPSRSGPTSSLHPATTFFALFLALLLLSAPQLVARHYVYLLYFTPFLVFAFFHVFSRLSNSGLALLGLLLLLGPRAFLLSLDRNPSYFAMAVWAKEHHRSARAFASSAVGAWYYYAGIETAHPMSAAMSAWLSQNQPELLHLDLSHSEVSPFAHLGSEADSPYKLIFALPGEKIYLKRGLGAGIKHNLAIDPGPAADWTTPRSLFLWLSPRILKQISSRPESLPAPFSQWATAGKSVAVYALRQPPGPQGSAFFVRRRECEKKIFFHLCPALLHVLPFARSDGVHFLGLTSADGLEKAPERRLVYSRFLGEAETRSHLGQLVEMAPGFDLTLVTLPGPRLESSFDDAFWLWPHDLCFSPELRGGE